MYSDGLRFFGVARMKPILYLIPTPLGAPDTPCLLPYEQQAIVGLTDFVVEAEKTARAHVGIVTKVKRFAFGKIRIFWWGQLPGTELW